MVSMMSMVSTLSMLSMPLADTVSGMPAIFAVFIFFFGASIGSFLNVCALRYNTGQTLGGRSSCASCARTLLWYELVPVISYIALRGKCRTCKSSFSVQYVLVEILTGLAFAALYFAQISLAAFLAGTVLFSIYIVIGVYDIRHMIVPNGLAYAAAIIAFGMLFVDAEALTLHTPSWWALLAGPIAAMPLFLFWLISRGKWMGLGDAKLALSIGWVLGVSKGVAALLIAFWSGALFGIGLIAYSVLTRKIQRKRGKHSLPEGVKRHTIKSEVPFAPFLLFGFTIAFFFGVQVATLILWNW